MSHDTDHPKPLSHEAALERILSLQDELASTRATLEKERATSRRFARRLSQDFRIPLNAMLGFSQLLQSSMRENLDSLEKVLHAGSHMLELIEEMGVEGPEGDDTSEDIRRESSLLKKGGVPEGALAATSSSVRPILPGAGQGGRVLYVEDQLTNIQMVELILGRHLGVAVDAVGTGWEGIAAALRLLPDLILLDLNLPDMHGSEVLDHFRGNPATARIPIIILSSDAAPTQIDRMLARGALDYLVKPFKMERLKESVAMALREAKARQD